MRWLAVCALLGAATQAQAQSLDGMFQSAAFMGWMVYGPAACSFVLAVLMLTFPEACSLLWKIVLCWLAFVAFCYGVLMGPSPSLAAFFFLIFAPWMGLIALLIGMVAAVKRSNRSET